MITRILDDAALVCAAMVFAGGVWRTARRIHAAWRRR